MSGCSGLNVANGEVTPRLCEASLITDCILSVLFLFRADEELLSFVGAGRFLDSIGPDRSNSWCRNESNWTPRDAILLCSNLPRYLIVLATSCVCSLNSGSLDVRWRVSRLRMTPAATEKAWSIHKTGPVSSVAAKASRRIVLEAAIQVLRVKEKAVFVKDRPTNLRWLVEAC
jgi:hypothetical protein